jgi:hypothetical protein
VTRGEKPERSFAAVIVLAASAFALLQEGFGVAFQLRKITFDYVPDQSVAHDAVAVNQAISEGDNPLAIGDSRFNVRKVT